MAAALGRAGEWALPRLLPGFLPGFLPVLLPRLPSGLPPLPARGCGHAAGWDRRERSYWRALRRRLLGPPVPPFAAPVQVGAPVLRGAAAAVSPEQLGSPELRRLAAALAAGLRGRPCLGLSAPQLGVPLRVFAAELPPARCARYPPALSQAHRIEPFPLRVLVNPALRVLDTRLVTGPEGCASIHGFSAYVPRHWAVHVSGTDRPRTCPSLTRVPPLSHGSLNSLMGSLFSHGSHHSLTNATTHRSPHSHTGPPFSP